MNIIFEVPANELEIIEDIKNQCNGQCECLRKDNLSGDQIIAIVAIAAPIIWELVMKYLSYTVVTIEVRLDEEHTLTITDRSFERAKMKAERYKAEWEKNKKI